jgi:hypothetical protein
MVLSNRIFFFLAILLVGQIFQKTELSFELMLQKLLLGHLKLGKKISQNNF